MSPDPPIHPPFPIEARIALSPTRVRVSFDRPVTALTNPDPAPFTLAGGLFAVGEAYDDGLGVIAVEFSGAGTPTAISYVPPPSFIVGIPDMLDAQPWSDFPISE